MNNNNTEEEIKNELIKSFSNAKIALCKMKVANFLDVREKKTTNFRNNRASNPIPMSWDTFGYYKIS